MAQLARTANATVLIVEHEALVRLELAGRLAEFGLIALEAANADEAIILLQTHRQIELLFTDIKMPGSMDGVRLAHYVSDRWPLLKIIVMSGMFSTQLAELPLGSLFLAKPYDLESLANALAHLLGNSDPGNAGCQATLRA